jgi:hypothetical protein
MKKILFHLCLVGAAAGLLSSCETEQITPTTIEDTSVLLNNDPPSGGGPRGGKAFPQKVDTLIVK